MKVATRNVIKIGSSPSLRDIEQAGIDAAEIGTSEPVVLILPRNTRSNLFVESALARLIAGLSRKGSRLLVRDSYSSWTEPDPAERFLETLDGVSALVHCTSLPSFRGAGNVLRESNRLENLK